MSYPEEVHRSGRNAALAPIYGRCTFARSGVMCLFTVSTLLLHVYDRPSVAPTPHPQQQLHTDASVPVQSAVLWHPCAAQVWNGRYKTAGLPCGIRNSLPAGARTWSVPPGPDTCRGAGLAHHGRRLRHQLKEFARGAQRAAAWCQACVRVRAGAACSTVIHYFETSERTLIFAV